MTFCPQCGRARSGDARFCGTCGHEFAQRAADAGPASTAGPGEPGTAVRPGQTRWDTPVAPSAGDSPAAPAWEPSAWDTPAPPPARDSPAAPAGEPSAWDSPAPAPAGDSPAAPAMPPAWAAPPGAGHQETVVAAPEPPGPGPATPPPGEPGNEPASPWAGWENTVTSGPAHAAGYASAYSPPAPYAPPGPTPSAPPGPAAPTAAGPAFPPPQPPPLPPDYREPRPDRRRTWIFVLAAVIVVLGAGGGAYALTRPSRPGTPTAGQSAGPAATSAPAATTTAPTAPTAATSDTAVPSASPSPSPTPSPTRTGTVQVVPAAANDPAEPQVLAYVTRYFNAINAHDYNAYYRLLDAQEQAGESRASFDSGYATTKDSHEVLTGIEDTGGGDVTANLSFTSRQNPSNSVDSSACNTWQISLYLVPQGSGYVQTAPPSGYHSSYGDC
jgi:hypothetical protein